MTVDQLAAEIEAELAWRIAELRHLRNTLLGEEEDPPIAAMRTLMVMQYAHLEGFARTALALYVSAVNLTEIDTKAAQAHLAAAALADEFERLRRNGVAGQSSEDGPLTTRAKNQVAFLLKMRTLASRPLIIDEKHAVSTEANLGSDVLQRLLFRLAIPPGEITSSQYKALDFVKNARNDIAHGDRKVRLEPNKFRAHLAKSEQLMNDLSRLIGRAFREKWYLDGAVAVEKATL